MLTRRQLIERLGPLGNSESRAFNSTLGDVQEFGPEEIHEIIGKLRTYVVDERQLLSAGAGFGIGKIANKLEHIAADSLLLMEAACRETSS